MATNPTAINTATSKTWPPLLLGGSGSRIMAGRGVALGPAKVGVGLAGGVASLVASAVDSSVGRAVASGVGDASAAAVAVWSVLDCVSVANSRTAFAVPVASIVALGAVVGVLLGGTRVRVAVDVAVAGTSVSVAVGGTPVGVAVGGTAVFVAVGGRGLGVAVDGTSVGEAAGVGVVIASAGEPLSATAATSTRTAHTIRAARIDPSCLL